MNECRFCHVIYEELRDKIKCETKHLEDQHAKPVIKKEVKEVNKSKSLFDF
jgi:hypothetical protein